MSWLLPSFSRSAADRLQAGGLSPVFARLLAARGWDDPETVAPFLAPQLKSLHSPWAMKGMEPAVIRILDAVQSQEPILIYGDYDVDGTTAVVVLRTALKMLGASPAYVIPQRLAEGYGLHREAIEQAARDGVKLIITVDTGIRAFEPVALATRLGMNVIVSDHHLPEDERLPEAFAILNPHQRGCAYQDKNLCGVGVAFKLAQALFERHGRLQPGDWPNWVQSFLKLVAIGTIADAVPLLGENRVIVRYGLQGLVHPVNPGLRALLRLALHGQESVKADDIAFRIAPRLNAAGRMGGAETVVELFSADEAQAAVAAEQLEQLNQQRRVAVELILREIEARLDAQPGLCEADILVLDGDGWHRGVLGIVASRVQHKFGKPVLIIAREEGMAHGSGRAPEGVHLLEWLETCPELFERFGGHAQAVGFSLPCSEIEALRRRLNEAAGQQERILPDRSCADTEIRLSEIQPGLLQDLERLEPCGHGNPVPQFLARGVRLAGEPRILKEKHLKLQVEQGGACFEALAWNVCGDGSENRPELPAPERMTAGSALDLIFSIEVTQHPQYGRRTQLILKDYRMAGVD